MTTRAMGDYGACGCGGGGYHPGGLSPWPSTPRPQVLSQQPPRPQALPQYGGGYGGLHPSVIPFNTGQIGRPLADNPWGRNYDAPSPNLGMGGGLASILPHINTGARPMPSPNTMFTTRQSPLMGLFG